MNKREVGYSTLFTLIKNNPKSIIGILFPILSILIFVSVTILSFTIQNPYEKYDFESITKNGIKKSAKVISKETVYNVTVNGEHPVIITYEYENNGQIKLDKLQSMDLDKILKLDIGSEVAIKVYNNESQIENIEPFSFPIVIFYILPMIFLLIGIVAFFMVTLPVLRAYELYKNGVLKEAKVISVEKQNGLPISKFGESIIVSYYYIGVDGNKIFGKSNTNDYSMLNARKEDGIKVFVSENDEKQSCLVPILYAMQNNLD